MKAIAAVYESMIQAHSSCAYPCGELLKIDNMLVHNAVNLAAEQVPVLPKNATEEERAPSSRRAACSERCAMQPC